MADNIVQIQPRLEVVGESYRFDPDEVLESAKGSGFETLVVIGQLPDGDLYVAGNANAGESLVLMERAKMKIIEA